MATATTKQRAIRYLNRDFESFKKDMIEHLRIYFPNTVQDFNESHVGMMLLELMAFVGDNLSFYLDRKFEETFTETAREAKNILKHAKQQGFKPFGKTAASGLVTGFLKIPAITVDGQVVPNTLYAGTVKKNGRLKSKSGQSYEIIADADFSTVDINDPAFVRIGDVDAATNVPKNFVLRKDDIEVRAGETKTTTVTVTGYEAFKKITLADEDVLEIISVKDSEGNTWYEVDFLAQDTIFQSLANTGDDASEVPFVLKLRTVPYRFVTEYDIATNLTSIVFGSGDAQELDGELVPDLGDLALPLFGKDSFSGFFLDPQNFLKVRTLGLAPVNTTLTIQYRVGGGSDTNVGATELNTVVSTTFDVGDSTLPSSTVNDVGNSFEVINFSPIQGGRDQLSNEEIKQLISAFFATQNRMVTTPDFVARSLSMPSKFGSVFRVSATPSPLNKNAVELYVLSKNSAGNVTAAPGDLKQNLKTYLGKYRMATDAIEILDGEIINIAVNFGILTDLGSTKAEVLVSCIEAMKEYFAIDSWQMNQPINKTDITRVLADIPGVLSIINLDFENRVGTVDGRRYSNTVHNIKANTKNGIIYSRENAIFEVKFLGKDIAGIAK